MGCSPSPEELRAFLCARIADFKVPRRVLIRDSLPRDDSGKVFKRLLRDEESVRAQGRA